MADKKEGIMIAPEREAMLENWRAIQTPPDKKDLPEPEQVKKAAEPPTESKEAAVPAVKTETQDEEKRVKMVPHEALHAEREQTKALREALQKKDEQVNLLLSDLQKLTESKETEKPIEDYDKAIIDLRRENAELKKEIGTIKQASDKRMEWEKEETAKKSEESLNKQLSETNSRLEKEGYPGFTQFVPLVSAELQRLVREDQANAHLDNPKGWEKIYREIVFPRIRETSINQKLKEKEERKKAAEIPVGSGGSPSAPLKPEEPWTVDSYMDMRKKRAL